MNPNLDIDKLNSFKELLDSRYSWPADYVFKFIVKKDYIAQLSDLFPPESITYKNSTQGNFVSLTLSIVAQSSDEIVAHYTRAASVPTLIAL